MLKAHRLLHHSLLGSRVIKKKRESVMHQDQPKLRSSLFMMPEFDSANVKSCAG